MLYIKNTRNKINTCYKSLYLKEELAKKIEKIAIKYNTSFNNVIVSMIETCLNQKNK